MANHLTQKPRRSRRSETAGPEQRRGQYFDDNNFLSDVYSLLPQIVRDTAAKRSMLARSAE
jgi:hypothetical protein